MPALSALSRASEIRSRSLGACSKTADTFLLASAGAAEFARSQGIEPVAAETLVTPMAQAALDRVRSGAGTTGWAGGTIGAVARDAQGDVAAATSTGGTIGKRRGRVGDSPILGAGTYADNFGGAISVTGDGEAVLRYGLAMRVNLRLGRGEEVLLVAKEELTALASLGGTGGLILVTADGEIAFARSTRTMSYAWVSAFGEQSGT